MIDAPPAAILLSLNVSSFDAGLLDMPSTHEAPLSSGLVLLIVHVRSQAASCSAC